MEKLLFVSRKTKSEPSAAGPILGGGATERASGGDFEKKRRRERYKVRDDDGAGDEIRTRYLHLGKVALCQMSYARIRRTLL